MLDYTLFGESHGPVVGVLLRHVPAGLAVDEAEIERELLRRRPSDPLATARRETDPVQLLSGVFQGRTTGMPLVLVIPNGDTRSGDYDALRAVARPGHADLTAWLKSHGYRDYRGGGHFSGRLTAPLTAAGVIAREALSARGVTVTAAVEDEAALRRRAAAAKAEGDSVGGRIVCTVSGLPAGIGGPDWYDAVESEIARHVFAIPAVKAVAFGAGESFGDMRGSQANDPLRTDGTHIWSTTNHNGGINGGISNGMPLCFTVTFKPTPSIAREQETVALDTMENCSITVTGRHDPCIALRSAPIVEAVTALALWRLLEPAGDDPEALRGQIDETDRELVALFLRRQELARRMGEYKRAHDLPVRDEAREAEVLRSRGDLAPEQRCAVERLFETLMELSREVQT